MSQPGGGRLRVRLVVDSDRTGVFSFEEWMSKVARAIDQLADEVRELHEQAADIRSELAALKTMNDTGEQRLRSILHGSDDLQGRMNDLDQRLDSVLAQLNNQFGASSQTEQGMRHHEYAAEFTSLVEQKAVAIARDICATVLEKAQFVAAVCIDLFGAGEVREQDLMSRLPGEVPVRTIRRVQEICADARSLRAKASESRAQRWDFRCDRGVPVDDSWQQVWAGSDLDGVVDFVVAPAYVVDANVLLTKQLVFTTKAPAEPPGPGHEAPEDIRGARPGAGADRPAGPRSAD
jgi:hypothetical protein